MNQSAPISQPGAVAAEPNPAGGLGRIFGRQNAEQIKRKSVRGGAVTLVSQGFKFVLTTATTMVMARLLTPADFGLQGMIVAWTGIVGLFGDIGLSMATIQSDTVTHEQTSTLFWINVALGLTLTAVVASMAPLLAAFNHEPRLFWMTLVVASTFLLGGLGVQHSALLVREMRFLALAKVQIASLVAGSLTGIAMAAYGCGYWALVGSMVAAPLVNVAGLWLSVRWRPGRPRRGFGLRSALHFGGILTLNNVVVYLGYNLEKVLLGRFWGADALGLYGKSYSLANLPVTQLHNAIYTVAFPTFSRLQSEPERLRAAFLKVYATVVSLSIPVTLCCILFAPEMIHIALGPQWDGAVPIFRLLGPTVLALGMINPFGWFLISTGRVVRSFYISLLIAPAVILGILGGLHYGPKGVALAYSTVMLALIPPVILWAIHQTGITTRDILKTLWPAIFSGICATAAGLLFNVAFGQTLTPILRLILGTGLVVGVDAWVLLWVMGQKPFFVGLFKELVQRGRG